MLDIQQILKILPHRYPFLLVDKVVEASADKVVAHKYVTFNEPQFNGHFPGQPVMPGVLMIEALAQTGAILAHQAGGFDPANQILLFMTIDKAKFRRQVGPGDRLDLTVTPLRKGGKVWKMRGEAHVEGELAAEAEFMATIAPKA